MNVPESAIDSIDNVLDGLGFPEPGPALKRISPDNVLDALGVQSPDELSDEMLRKLDENFDITFPPER